jgi:hypothetical protein
MGREIRIEISDAAYEQLLRSAAEQRVAAEDYAGRLLDRGLAGARFRDGAREFIGRNADAFAEHFGGCLGGALGGELGGRPAVGGHGVDAA